VYNDVLNTLADTLQKRHFNKSVLIGFDGFVDEIIDVVSERIDTQSYSAFDTIQQFGDRIQSFAQESGNIELVTKQIKLGGNGPIMANAMLQLGYQTYYIGSIGKPDVHSVFQEMANACATYYSLAEAAHTDALEFSDGKIMLGKITSLEHVHWDNLVHTVGLPALKEILSQVDLLSTNNWSMITQMNTIWVGLIDLLPKIQRTKPLKLFIDLADPTKRIHSDILEALQLVTQLNRVASVILGLNKHEAFLLAELLGITLPADDPEGIRELATNLRNQLSLNTIVIHPTKFACAATEETSAYSPGPYTPKPKLSTGAGDNFNAGFCSGVLQGVDLESCLIMGVATSGYYVRNAASPNPKQLISFLRKWASDQLKG
jgi:hypothetical protein